MTDPGNQHPGTDQPTSQPDDGTQMLQQLLTQQLQLMAQQLAALSLAEGRQPAVLSSNAPAVQQDTASEPGSDAALTSAALAPGQLEHWLAATAGSNTRVAINESLCLVFEGDVDVPALRQAAELVCARHEAFRIAFARKEPRQQLVPFAALRVTEVDLRGAADPDVALDEFCAEAGGQLFDLERPPLATAHLIRLTRTRCALLLVVSHLVFDGWASSVFVDELSTTYKALRAGTSAELDPPASALTFADEESRLFHGADGKDSLAWWQAQLVDPPPLLDVHDRVIPVRRSFAAGTLRSTLDEATVVRLRARARAAGVTLFQLVLGAVAATLGREAGRRDFVISIPFASQLLRDRGPLFADGILDLPLRFRTDGWHSPRAAMQDVRARLMNAIDHPRITQAAAARALGVRGAQGRPPLTGIYFNLNPRIDVTGFPGIDVSLFEGRKRGLLSDLFFSFYEVPAGLALDLHYARDLFSATRVEQLVAALWKTCTEWTDQGSAQAPSAPMANADASLPSAVSGSTSASGRYLFRPHPGQGDFRAWISEQVLRAPDAVAVRFAEGSLTYGELEQRSSAIAHMLRARGAGPGQFVGICLGRGRELLPVLLGVLKTGAAYVPLDPAFPAPRLRYMSQDAGLALVVTEARHAALAGLPREQQLRMDDDAAELVATVQSFATVACGADAAAYLIYTSGSTGKPKGVLVPHGAVANFLASMAKVPGLAPDDVLLAVTTLSFDIAVTELLLPLCAGARIVLAQHADLRSGERLAALIRDHQVTVMQATPTTWQMLLDTGWSAPPGFRALCGGESLPLALARSLTGAGAELWNLYGPTETTVWSTLSQVTSPVRHIDVGRPLDNTSIWIVDATLRPCARGESGEIVIGGAGVALGYHGLPALTADRFIPAARIDASATGRAYRTGDLGRWTAEGKLEHLGRIDAQVKIRGHRIEPAEVEGVIGAQPGVAQVAVVVDTQGAAPLLCAYLRLSRGASIDMQAIRAASARVLPDYMIPSRWLVIDDFPLTANGKIDRLALSHPGPGAGARNAPARHVAPANDAEAALLPIWSSVLRIDGCGVLDDFFEAGGDSIKAVQLMARIQAELGHDLAPEVLFDQPNIRGLAAAIASRLELSAGIAVPLREAPDGPVLVMIAGVGGHIFAYHKFAQALPVDAAVYGMKAVGIDGSEPPLNDIPQIARRYVIELLARHDRRPFVIAGYSVGGRIALEVALQLEALGRRVARVVIFDMFAPGFPHRAPLRQRAASHLKQLRRRNLAGRLRYLLGVGRFALANEAERNRHELAALGIVPEDLLQSIGVGLLEAGMNYLPEGKVRAGIISIVCTHAEEWEERVVAPMDKGWSMFTTGNVELRRVDAGHLDLFKPALFPLMTGMMADVLRDARLTVPDTYGAR